LTIVHAIILAGGLGTRLRSVVSDVPKSLADVSGRPFIEYLFAQLGRDGFTEAVVCAGYMSDAIEAWLATAAGHGINAAVSLETEPLGTAGAVKNAEPYLVGDRWLLMNGDSFFDISLGTLVAAHESNPALVTIALARVEDGQRYGRVTCDADGVVLGFEEKTSIPGGGLINSGLYIIERPLLAQIPADRPASLERDVLPALGRGEVRAVELDGYFVDIGVPDDYARAQRDAEVLEKLI
jgi:D-glycero-alpha-D-manno-heptose 1-phosphate guanylyltransferase